MRRSRAATAAMVLCLAGGGPLALAQGTSSDPPSDSPGHGLVQVTGTFEASGLHCFGAGFCGFEGDTMASDERLTGCYWLVPTGRRPEGAWGTLTVYVECSGFWGMPSSDDTITWSGEWFTAGERDVQSRWTGPSPSDHAVPSMGSLYPVDAVWLHGRGGNEGWSASLRIEDGTLDAWLFPTPETTTDTDGDGALDAIDACPWRGDEGYGVDGSGCPNIPDVGRLPYPV